MRPVNAQVSGQASGLVCELARKLASELGVESFLTNQTQQASALAAILTPYFLLLGALVRALLAIVLVTLSLPATATERYYAEYQLGIANIRHSDLKFRSADGRLILGGYYAKGLGAEVSYGGPFRVGEDGGFDVQMERLTTAALRFESPAQDGVSAYVLLGVSRFAISQRGVDSLERVRTVRETFQGGTLTFGLRKQLDDSRFSLVAAYQIHYVDQPIDTDTYTLGLRVAW